MSNKRIVPAHRAINPELVLLSMMIPGETFNAFAAAGAEVTILTQEGAEKARQQKIADAQAHGIDPTGARTKDRNAVDSGVAQMQVKMCSPLTRVVRDLQTVGYNLTKVEVVKDETKDTTKLRLHFSNVIQEKAPEKLVEMAKPWLKCSWRICYIWSNPHAHSVTFNCDEYDSVATFCNQIRVMAAVNQRGTINIFTERSGNL